MDNKQAFIYFAEARQQYLSGNFKQAQNSLRYYKQYVDYRAFEKVDNRESAQTSVSVIIVCFNADESLIDCVNSVINQVAHHFEIIIVDNGGNESLHTQLKKLPILWVSSSVNLFPSEGRNVGAYFARSNILIFLDDDAIMNPDYISIACAALKDDSLIALRGRIKPKRKSIRQNEHIPKHYDLGDTPKPAILDLEGNMVIRNDVFKTVGGFDPLMFGHEGKELSNRCSEACTGKFIYYWPSLVIFHDYAEGDCIQEKMSRQLLSEKYLNFIEGKNLKPGVSIVVKNIDNNELASKFLDSLIMHNSYKPVEVVYAVLDVSSAVEFIRRYITKIPIRVVQSDRSVGRLAKSLRYDQVIIINKPLTIQRDCLSDWIKECKTDIHGSRFCRKSELTNEKCWDIDDSILQTGEVHDDRPVENMPNPRNDNSQSEESYFELKDDPTKKLNNDVSERPIVSFILPVFNKVEYIESALNSILALDIEGIECIAVDDCSNDGSREVVSRLARLDKRIKVIYNEQNIGAGASRNKGIHHANGRYLFFLDADDSIDRKAFTQMLEYAVTTNAEIVRGKITGVSPEGKTVTLAKEHQLHSEYVVGAKWIDETSLWFYWYFSANLYKRDFLINNHISFPEGVRNEDPVFLCKAYLYANNIVLVPNVVYLYLITISQKKREPTFDFLNGWVRGYYSIYQMIQTQKKQTTYFLLDFPSLIPHTKSIVMFLEKHDALPLLDCISVMFRVFEKYLADYSEELKFKLHFVKKDYMEFARLLGSSTGQEIYDYIKANNLE